MSQMPQFILGFECSQNLLHHFEKYLNTISLVPSDNYPKKDFCLVVKQNVYLILM